MKSKNLNYLYNTEYLESILLGERADYLNDDLKNKIDENSNYWINYGKRKIEELKKLDGVKTSSFLTIYPGLLFGLGYTHQTKNPNEDDKNRSKDRNSTGQLEVGFNFDFVTGVPEYPGSSLKGIIRSIFNNAISNKEYLDYLNKNLSEILNHDVNLDNNQVKTLLSVFEDGSDIFYGAFVTEYKNNGIMDFDYITNHHPKAKGEKKEARYFDKEAGQKALTKNPTPIQMLRIVPGVTITTCIKVKGDIVIDDIVISADSRYELYNRIVLDFGLGAKTNVGYGKLEKVL